MVVAISLKSNNQSKMNREHSAHHAKKSPRPELLLAELAFCSQAENGQLMVMASISSAKEKKKIYLD
jgi:hypothetical protein